MDTVVIRNAIEYCREHSVDVLVYRSSASFTSVFVSGRNKEGVKVMRKVPYLDIIEAQNTLSPDPVLRAIREVFEELTSKPTPHEDQP